MHPEISMVSLLNERKGKKGWYSFPFSFSFSYENVVCKIALVRKAGVIESWTETLWEIYTLQSPLQFTKEVVLVTGCTSTWKTGGLGKVERNMIFAGEVTKGIILLPCKDGVGKKIGYNAQDVEIEKIFRVSKMRGYSRLYRTEMPILDVGYDDSNTEIKNSSGIWIHPRFHLSFLYLYLYTTGAVLDKNTIRT